MNDGNVLIHRKDNIIQMVKIKKNEIEEISVFFWKVEFIKVFKNDILLFDIITNKKEVKSGFFKGVKSYKYEHELYTYNNKFTFLKNITKIYKEEGVLSVFYINKNELALYTKKEIDSDNIDNYIIFYDMVNYKKIIAFKVNKDTIRGDNHIDRKSVV